MPDLAFVRHAWDVAWRNTMADLGSDNMIVEITVPTQGQMYGAKVDIPKEVRAKIHIAPVPRNMNPIYNQGHPEAQATALLKAYCNDKNARFTDATHYPDGGRFAIVVINSEKATTHTASVKTRHRSLLKKWPSRCP
ncbi:hypothetical protein HPB50_025859 [Hyalomma asiaticum]|uniref:Uncharacterized protein n=1 Tax=Hyalomma asiaticum TaxID=266040 RepID=A0ACB7TR05_HYAAI|nr:hypothetical protein HPB50_025859 [Hyalomma asiaticum]